MVERPGAHPLPVNGWYLSPHLERLISRGQPIAEAGMNPRF